MVKEAGFWTRQGKPTGMHLLIEEHEPAKDGTIAYWWTMEEAASESPYDLEVSARGYFASKEEAYEDAMDFALGFGCGVAVTLSVLGALAYRLYVLFRYGP